MGIIKTFIGNRIVKNAGWLILGKVLQMVVNLVVVILSARYLGPGNYGLISYAGSYTAFFTAICNLGINSVIVKELIDAPDSSGQIIGTAIGLRAISSVLSAAAIMGLSCVIDRGEPVTIGVVALYSVGLVFHVFETFNYWYHANLQSRKIVIGSLVAYTVTAAYKIILLATGQSVLLFALATSVEYICVAIVMCSFYHKDGGLPLKFSWSYGKQLLSRSFHYILPGIMVAIYGQTDKVMLKHMIDDATIGYYATAVSLCSVWCFVLTAIIDSMNPSIMQANKANPAEFRRLNVTLYAIVFWISVLVSLGFVLLGDYAIAILYGEAYLPAVQPLKVVTWYTAFAYLGVARNAWIVCSNKQRYLKYIYIPAALSNVVLNLMLIPRMGATGAALASLIAQIVTTMVVPFCIRDLRENAAMMLDAMLLRNVFPNGRRNNESSKSPD